MIVGLAAASRRAADRSRAPASPSGGWRISSCSAPSVSHAAARSGSVRVTSSSCAIASVIALRAAQHARIQDPERRCCRAARSRKSVIEALGRRLLGSSCSASSTGPSASRIHGLRPPRQLQRPIGVPARAATLAASACSDAMRVGRPGAATPRAPARAARHRLLVAGDGEEARQRVDQRRAGPAAGVSVISERSGSTVSRGPAERDQQLHHIAMRVDRRRQRGAPGPCSRERLFAGTSLQRDVCCTLEQLLVALRRAASSMTSKAGRARRCAVRAR